MDTLLPEGCRILEGVMTTVSDAAPFENGAPRDEAALGLINIAPMGPIVDADTQRLIFRPFTSSTTYQNLKRTGEGVFHVTDDVLLMVRGAIGRIAACWASQSHGSSAALPGRCSPVAACVRPAEVVRGVVLTGACRYHEFKVTSLDDSQERTRIEAQVVRTGRLRDFFGFNRAMNAVLEAAILATRIHLTGPDAVLAEMDRLTPPIEKTGGDNERRAMRELRSFVETALRPRYA